MSISQVHSDTSGPDRIEHLFTGCPAIGPGISRVDRIRVSSGLALHPRFGPEATVPGGLVEARSTEHARRPGGAVCDPWGPGSRLWRAVTRLGCSARPSACGAPMFMGYNQQGSPDRTPKAKLRSSGRGTTRSRAGHRAPPHRLTFVPVAFFRAGPIRCLSRTFSILALVFRFLGGNPVSFARGLGLGRNGSPIPRGQLGFFGSGPRLRHSTCPLQPSRFHACRFKQAPSHATIQVHACPNPSMHPGMHSCMHPCVTRRLRAYVLVYAQKCQFRALCMCQHACTTHVRAYVLVYAHNCSRKFISCVVHTSCMPHA